MKTGVYTITNRINGKLYVGSTSQSFKERKRHHFRDLELNTHGNSYLQRSYNKYGKENFIFEILEECDKDYCISQEQYWINMLNVCNDKYGYNICSVAGSTLGTKRTPEQCENISKSLIGKLAGDKHPMWGKKRLPTFLGKKHTPEAIEKMKNFQKSRKRSVEEIEGIRERSKAQRGDKHPNFGKTPSPKMLALLALANKGKPSMRRRPIRQLSLQGIFLKDWDYVSQASVELKIDASSIVKCCKGKLKTYKGFKWEYTWYLKKELDNSVEKLLIN